MTLNDVCLAMASGALRDLALARGESPRPLKAMVPVSLRSAGDDGSLGNRVSFAFIDLPLDVAGPDGARASATAAFKRGGKPAGAEAVLGALGLLPDPLRNVARSRRTRASTTHDLEHAGDRARRSCMLGPS